MRRVLSIVCLIQIVQVCHSSILTNAIYMRVDIPTRGVLLQGCDFWPDAVPRYVKADDDGCRDVMMCRDANEPSNSFVIFGGTNMIGIYSGSIVWAYCSSQWMNISSADVVPGHSFWNGSLHWQVMPFSRPVSNNCVVMLPVGDSTNVLYENPMEYVGSILSASFLSDFAGRTWSLGMGMPYKSPMLLHGDLFFIYDALNVTGMLRLSSLDGTNGFNISGSGNEGLGNCLLEIGDVNGDTHSELLVSGAHTYILLGRTNKFPFAHATAAEVFDGTNGWAVNITAGKYSAVGDFNGDGLADWAAGTTIIFGSRSSLHGMTNLTDGTGVAFSYDAQRSVPPENFGDTIAGCGDVNADGYADFIVGSNHNNFPSYIDPHNAYIIYGRPLWPRCSMLLSNSFFDGVRGFIVQAAYDEKGMGRHVGGKGDFNGDGYDDPLIGATPDELYVFFGGESPAWPPALLSPVRVVDSTTGFREYDPGTNPYWDSTNVVVVGMKATNAAVYVRVNGTWQPGPVAAFGTRWFTNDLRWHMNQPLTIEYASSNALGWSVNRTVLIVSAVPEPMQAGAWLTLLVAVGSRRHRANPNRQDAKDAKGRRAGQFNRRKDNHDKTA